MIKKHWVFYFLDNNNLIITALFKRNSLGNWWKAPKVRKYVLPTSSAYNFFSDRNYWKLLWVWLSFVQVAILKKSEKTTIALKSWNIESAEKHTSRSPQKFLKSHKLLLYTCYLPNRRRNVKLHTGLSLQNYLHKVILKEKQKHFIIYLWSRKREK